MTKVKAWLVLAALAGGALRAGAWPRELAPDAAAQVEALMNAGLSPLAVDRAALAREVPAELVAEAKLRSALERSDRRDAERLVASLPTTPMTYLTRAVLALDRGQPAQAESIAQAGMAALGGHAVRPLWELTMLRATAMLRQSHIAPAVALLLDMPAGRDALPWSPYLALLNMADQEDPDRTRLLRLALQDDSYNPDARTHAIRLALMQGDTDAMDRQFFEHAKLRGKRIPRFQPRRSRRFFGLASVPFYGPVNPTSKAEIYGEFARIAIARDNPGTARMCQSLAAVAGDWTDDARWLFARLEIAFADLPRAREHLVPLARVDRFARPELGWVQAWSGEGAAALATLASVSRQRADEPTPRLARLRALIDVDPAAAQSALAEEALPLGIHPDYWAIAALAAHRRADAPAFQRAMEQLFILRRMGRVSEVKAFELASLLRELKRQGLARELLRPGGRDPFLSEFDARPLSFSAVVYRLIADRASVTGDTRAALEFVDRARAAMEQSALGRMGCVLSDLEPALRAYLPRLAYDSAYPIAQVAARVLLQAGDPPNALRVLNVFLGHGEPLTTAWFLLEASALGQMGQRDRINSMIAAGTILGARVGIPWGAFAQLLLVTGSDEGLHALARAARSLQDQGDDVDDLVALFGLGGLYAEALQTAAPTPGRGSDLGRGLALGSLGRAADARRALNAAAATPGPWAGPALCALADLEYRAKNLAGCRAALELLAKTRVDDYRVHVARAMIALLENDAAGAEAHAERALLRGPHAALTHLVRAHVARARGQPDVPFLAEAVRIAPHDARAWEELGRARLRDHSDARANLRQSAREAVDSGQLERAAAVLALVPGPRLPARPRYPYTDPRALKAAFDTLLAQGPPALRLDLAGQDLAREGALQLIELGDDAGARALVLEAIAREPPLVAPGGPGTRGPQNLPRDAAAVVMLLVLLLGPPLAGRALRRSAARTAGLSR